MDIQKKNNTIRCGVVGTGYLGTHHARIYSQMKNCEWMGVYDIDRQRAEMVVKEYGGKVFGSIEELASNCDAVSVVVPTDKHCLVTLPLIEGGCHVLVEKPLCVSLEEAAKILDCAHRNEKIVQVGHVEHYNPVMNYLEKNVTDPRFITADRLAPFNIRGTEVGVVLDLMIHDIGIILKLVKSPIKTLDCVGVNVLSSTEDIANARIVFENGCVANLNTSRVSMKKVREIRVFQPSTYLSLDFMNQTGHLLKKEGISLNKEDIPIEKGEPLALELASFIECIDKVQEPKVDAKLGTMALEVAIKITEKIWGGHQS